MFMKLSMSLSVREVEYVLRKYDDNRNGVEVAEFAQLVLDLRLTDPQSLAGRVRLRTHPKVMEALNRWWQVALLSMEPAHARTGQLVHNMYISTNSIT